MKNGGIDKRVIKTKNAIFEAFKQLVQEKDMSDITISELTQKANITRSTFYMYYDTVGDVRTDIENEIIARIDKIMSEDFAHKSYRENRLRTKSQNKTKTTDIFSRPARRDNFLTKSMSVSLRRICTVLPRPRIRISIWARLDTSLLLRRPVLRNASRYGSITRAQSRLKNFANTSPTQ